MPPRLTSKTAPPKGEPIKVSVDDLQFDTENPRFADADNLVNLDDKSIIKYYLEEVDLAELLDSISASGYVNFDPMLVMKTGTTYTVLEGNRRLAALRVLRNKQLAASLHQQIRISPTARKTLDDVHVQVMNGRAKARAYIGFKHINGPHKWDAMAKAQYATDWLRDGGTIEQITRTLGDRNNLVKRLVFGHLVLEQAESNGFDKNDRVAKNFHFSHLYTALTRPGYREFLGLDPSDLSFDPRKSPIPRRKVGALLELMMWLFGSREEEIEPAVRTQAPDLNRLNEVLQRKEAKRAFLAGRTLDEAYEYIESKTVRFSDPLFAALSNAQRALGLVSYYDGQRSLLTTAIDLVEATKALEQAMRAKSKSSRRG